MWVNAKLSRGYLELKSNRVKVCLENVSIGSISLIVRFPIPTKILASFLLDEEDEENEAEVEAEDEEKRSEKTH